jgi:hypothetical protein
MSSPTELAHIRTTITGMRNMLSSYFYCTDAMFELRRHPGLRFKLNHECGGVMDHLANILDALDELLDEPEAGDREPHFPPSLSPDITLTPDQVRDGWHFCPSFDGLLTQGENHTGSTCLCGHPNRPHD